MSASPLLAGIERCLVAKREYDRGRADEKAETLARSFQEAKEALLGQATCELNRQPKPLRILVAIDSAEHPAANAAIDLAEVVGGPLALIYVIEPSLRARVAGVRVHEESPTKVQRDEAVEMLEKCRSRIPVRLSSEWILREGNAAEEILSAAGEWGADMIVIGTRNRGALAQFFLGSTSSVVVRLATCPVLLVHESAMTDQKQLSLKELSHKDDTAHISGTLHKQIA